MAFGRDDILEFIIRGKDEFSSTFTKLRRGVGAAAKVVAGAGVAVAGLGTALVAMAKTTATTYDQVGKFAGRIGVTTEALSQYNHVADLSGISVQALNVGWQRMTRRISEAAQNTGIAKDALVELGLSATAINQLSPDKQFEAIAGALEGVASQGDKVRLAMKFWDTEGVGLLQTLKDGTAGLEAMKQEAIKFGLVVSGEAAANAAEFNDSLTRLTGSMRGVKNQISEDLMPSMSAMFNFIANWIAEHREDIVKMFKQSLVWAFNFAKDASLYVARFIDGWVGLQLMFLDIKIGFQEFVGFIFEKLADLIRGTGELLEKVNYKGIFDGIVEGTKNASDVVAAGSDVMKKSVAGLQKEFAAILGDESAEQKVRTFFEGLEASIAKAGQASDKGGGGPLNPERAAANMDALNTMYDDYFLSQEERLTEWYEKEQEKYKDNKEALAKLDKIYAKKRKKQQLDEVKTGLSIAGDMAGQLEGIAQAMGQRGVHLAKQAGIAKAIINTLVGVTNALSEYSPPVSFVMAALQLAFGLLQVQKIRSTNYGQAHAGLTNVPKEETYLLQRGERVVAPEQNQDLTDFLQGADAGEPAGGAITIQNLTVNSPMVKENWDRLAERQIVPAINRAWRRNIRLQGA